MSGVAFFNRESIERVGPPLCSGWHTGVQGLVGLAALSGWKCLMNKALAHLKYLKCLCHRPDDSCCQTLCAGSPTAVEALAKGARTNAPRLERQ